MRITLLGDAHQTGHHVEQSGTDCPDGDDVTAPLARIVDRDLQPLCMLHEPLHRAEDGSALTGQAGPVPRALEQPYADQLLQHLDLLTERRLRHAQALGRPAKMLLVGDGEKVPEVPQQPEVDHARRFPYDRPASRSGRKSGPLPRLVRP